MRSRPRLSSLSIRAAPRVDAKRICERNAA
jgi:hypothetical protein